MFTEPAPRICGPAAPARNSFPDAAPTMPPCTNAAPRPFCSRNATSQKDKITAFVPVARFLDNMRNFSLPEIAGRVRYVRHRAAARRDDV